MSVPADTCRALEPLALAVRGGRRIDSRRSKAPIADVVSTGRFVAGLLRPYRGQLATILVAMAVETAMRLAAPWPLKIVLDHVVGSREPPGWLRDAASLLPGHGTVAIAAVATLVSVIATAAGALAAYVDDYTTERVGQGIAIDLRLCVYHHLQLQLLQRRRALEPAGSRARRILGGGSDDARAPDPRAERRPGAPSDRLSTGRAPVVSAASRRRPARDRGSTRR